MSFVAAQQALDPAVLTRVVRQAARQPDPEVTNFTVQPLSGKGATNPEGRFPFQETGEPPSDSSSTT